MNTWLTHDLTKNCPVCDGYGSIYSLTTQDAEYCTNCNGTGQVPDDKNRQKDSKLN